MRNHRYRKTNLHQWQDEEDDTDDITEEQTDPLESSLDSAAMLIQGSMQNYKYHKGYIRYVLLQVSSGFSVIDVCRCVFAHAFGRNMHL